MNQWNVCNIICESFCIFPGEAGPALLGQTLQQCLWKPYSDSPCSKNSPSMTPYKCQSVLFSWSLRHSVTWTVCFKAFWKKTNQPSKQPPPPQLLEGDAIEPDWPSLGWGCSADRSPGHWGLGVCWRDLPKASLLLQKSMGQRRSCRTWKRREWGRCGVPRGVSSRGHLQKQQLGSYSCGKQQTVPRPSRGYLVIMEQKI